MIHGHCRIFIEEHGDIQLAFERHNLVTYIGKRVLSSMLADPGYPVPDRIKLGTQGNVTGDVLTPTAEDPAAEALNDPDPVEAMQYPGSPILVYAPPEISTRFIFVLEKNQPSNSGAIYFTEAGLFNANDELIAVEHFPAMVKTPQRRFIYEWSLFFPQAPLQ